MMKECKEKSQSNLCAFIKLILNKRDFGPCLFKADVTIKTVKRSTDFPCEIQISMRVGLGKISIFESEVDPTEFPTEFNAEWQVIQIIDGKYLQIQGEHMKNTNIGKYEVIIRPKKSANKR